MGCKSRTDAELDYLFIENGQSPRLPGAYGTAMGIRLSPESGGASAENFCVRCKFYVGFKARNKLVFHCFIPPFSSAKYAAESTCPSVNLLPIICKPIGSPSLSFPQGIEIAGKPQIFTGTVHISER